MHNHVCDSATSKRQRRRANAAFKKSKGDQHIEVAANGACDGEDDEKDVAGLVDGHAAVEFGEGCDEERAKGVAEDVDGDGKGG